METSILKNLYSKKLNWHLEKVKNMCVLMCFQRQKVLDLFLYLTFSMTYVVYLFHWSYEHLEQKSIVLLSKPNV